MNSLLSKLLPYERYLWIAALVVILVGFGVYTYHERGIGRQQVIDADARARADEHKKVQAETARLQQLADVAKAKSDATEKALEDYRRAHPVGPVRLCHPNSQPAGAGAVAKADPRDDGSGTGPAIVPPVLDGDSGEGPDIGPDIDTLVSAASELARLYRQFQDQPIPKSVK